MAFDCQEYFLLENRRGKFGVRQVLGRIRDDQFRIGVPRSLQRVCEPKLRSRLPFAFRSQFQSSRAKPLQVLKKQQLIGGIKLLRNEVLHRVLVRRSTQQRVLAEVLIYYCLVGPNRLGAQEWICLLAAW